MRPTIADRLLELRTEAGMSQRQLASALNISQQRYQYYETGKREPDIEMLMVFADYYHVPVDYLIGRNDQK